MAFGTLILLSEIDISKLSSHGYLIVLFLKETIEWCQSVSKKITNKSYCKLMIDMLCSIYAKNSNYINENSPNFKNNPIIQNCNEKRNSRHTDD